MKKDIFKIANKTLKSRLIVGTGKYKNFTETAKAVKASGADMVTVAVRRVNILDKKKPILTDYLNPKKINFLPNTAGCFTSEEALRTLRLAREMGGWKLVKLEVLGDKKTLYPNMIETIKSTKTLVKEGASIGANATIVCGNIIGLNSFVGAGSVVTKDVPDYALVVGNPAKQIGWVCECGKKLNDSLHCENCNKQYKLCDSGIVEKS